MISEKTEAMFLAIGKSSCVSQKSKPSLFSKNKPLFVPSHRNGNWELIRKSPYLMAQCGDYANEHRSNL